MCVCVRLRVCVDPKLTRWMLRRRGGVGVSGVGGGGVGGVGGEGDPTAPLAALVGDEEVQREAERVRHKDADNDVIVVAGVTKLRSVTIASMNRRRFMFNNASVSVQCVLDRVSFGVRKGSHTQPHPRV